MLNISMAKRFATPSTYKNINLYDVALKSKRQYICHHLEEIKNIKTGEYITTLQEVQNTPACDIQHISRKTLQLKNQYEGIDASKLMFIPYDVHNKLHAEVEKKVKSGRCKNTSTKKKKTQKFSTVGKRPVILKHYKNNISDEQMEKELNYYYRNGFYSWTKNKTTTKISKYQDKFLNHYGLKRNEKTEKFFKTTKWKNMVSSYTRCGKEPWLVITKKYEEMNKLIEKLK